MILRHLDFVVHRLRRSERNCRQPQYFDVVFNMIFHKFTNFHRRFFRPTKSREVFRKGVNTFFDGFFVGKVEGMCSGLVIETR